MYIYLNLKSLLFIYSIVQLGSYSNCDLFGIFRAILSIYSSMSLLSDAPLITLSQLRVWYQE